MASLSSVWCSGTGATAARTAATTSPLSTVHLDDDERAWLEFRPFAMNEVPADLHWALEAEHPEPHAANAQIGNGVEWWVRWTLRAFEIARMRGCRVERANTDLNSREETDVCLLFANHPGRHSYEIGE